jgi:hypothetical protein
MGLYWVSEVRVRSYGGSSSSSLAVSFVKTSCRRDTLLRFTRQWEEQKSKIKSKERTACQPGVHEEKTALNIRPFPKSTEISKTLSIDQANSQLSQPGRTIASTRKRIKDIFA